MLKPRHTRIPRNNRKPVYFRSRNILIYLWTTLFSLFFLSCNTDVLKTPSGPKKNDGDSDVQGVSTIQPGATFWYQLSRSYVRNTSGGVGGLTEGEKEVGGHLCIVVDQVDDTATPVFASAAETLVHGRARVQSSLGIDLSVTDQDNPGAADPQVVDDAHASLWLKHLTFPSRNHGLLDASPWTFSTQSGLAPPQAFGHLPFFDVRVLPDKGWGGFSDPLDLQAPPKHNLLMDFYNYFSNVLGLNLVDNTQFRAQTLQANNACAAFVSLNSCSGSGCEWDTLRNACSPKWSVQVTWRQFLGSEALELAGPAIHGLTFEYDSTGALLRASEVIIPDNGQNPLPLATSCASGACATATLSRIPNSFASAPCSF